MIALHSSPRITDSYKKLALGFVILTVLILLIILYFSTGRALITVTSRVTPVTTDFVTEVTTDGGGDGSLRGVLFTVEEEGTETGDATGTKIMASDSLGQVKLINKRAESQSLVKTTRLLADNGVLLRLTDKVDIPANGEVMANVYADDPNSFTELAPTKFKIPGLWEGLQALVYAESAVTLKTKGSSVKSIKQEDIDRTKAALNKKLFDQGIADFKKNLGVDKNVIVVVAQNPLSENISALPDTEADNVTIKSRLKLVLVALDQDAIIAEASKRLQDVVPSGWELLNLDKQKLSYIVQNFNPDAQTANIKVHIEGATVLRADNEIFKKDTLAGLTDKAVQFSFSNFKEVEAVKVEFSPFWVTTVPRMKDHVTIVIDNLKGVVKD